MYLLFKYNSTNTDWLDDEPQACTCAIHLEYDEKQRLFFFYARARCSAYSYSNMYVKNYSTYCTLLTFLALYTTLLHATRC